MSVVQVLYQQVLRRPARFFAVAAVASLFFERTVDIGIENLYDSMNRGKQWKDICDKYQNK